MSTTATKRRCNGKACVAFLSTYNNDPDGLCGPCRKTQTDEWVGRLREQMDARDSIPETRPGSQMWRVLRAMPGTAREIADKTGIDLKKVRVTARDAALDGRAKMQRRPRTGSQGEVKEYVCLVDLPKPAGAPPGRKYNRETLIEALHQMKRSLGRAPTPVDCGNPWPSRSSFTRYFKTWEDGLQAAGIRAKGTPRAEYMGAMANGPTTSTDLAKQFGRNVNTVTSVLFHMYEAGLVNREWQPKGRRYLYSLNEQDGA